MSDILDYLSNNWQSLLGLGSQQAQTPLPAPIAGASGGFSPSGVVDTNALMPQPPTQAQTYNYAQAGWPTYQPDTAAFSPAPSQTPTNAASVPAASLAPPSAVPATSPATSAPPLANLRPQIAPTGAPLSLAPPNPTAPGPPLSLAAPSAATSPPPSTGSPTTLQQLLGVRTQPWQNAFSTGVAALGRGLSTVQGNTGAGAFARGMGGALQGGTQYTQQQQAQNFNMASGYFKDMLAAKNADDAEAYRRAQAGYLNSRAQAIQLGGGTGSSAWQNTPYGKTIQVENEAQKYEKGQQILLQKRWALNGTSPEQQQSDLDNLQKQVDAYRGRLYKSAGIDPAQGANVLKYGTSPDTPFSTKGMTLNQFNEGVPMGAWYTDQNGVVRQRTVPPSGGVPSTSAAASPGAQMQQYYDDSLALSPAQ